MTRLWPSPLDLARVVQLDTYCGGVWQGLEFPGRYLTLWPITTSWADGMRLRIDHHTALLREFHRNEMRRFGLNVGKEAPPRWIREAPDPGDIMSEYRATSSRNARAT
jgi:hypothetical protein